MVGNVVHRQATAVAQSEERWLGGEKRMRRRGMLLARRSQHFTVTATKGPLVEGELERARAWGEQLARSVELGTAGAAAG